MRRVSFKASEKGGDEVYKDAAKVKVDRCKGWNPFASEGETVQVVEVGLWRRRRAPDKDAQPSANTSTRQDARGLWPGSP